MSRLIAAATAALIAVAQADNYVWNGAPLSFSDESLWTGASPLGGAVQYTIFGSSGDNTVATAPMATYAVGNKIQFFGNAKLILGDGRAGSITKLQLENTASNAPVATFAPSELDADATAGGSALDYNCHLNWLVNNAIPDTPPQSDDRVSVKDSATEPYLMVSSRVSTAARIVGSNNAVMTSCTSPPDLGLLYIKFSPNCQGSNFFDDVDAVETSCAGALSLVLPNGDVVQYFNDGPRAGQAFREGDNGLEDISDQVTTETSPTGDPIYKIGGTILDPSSAASTSAESSSSSTIIIIIVAAVVVIGIIVAVVVVVVKKQGTKDASTDRGIVSFENPMYDDVQGGEQDTSGGGMYDEPTMTGTSGYMDVPAGGEGGAGGSGYMDVAPGEEGFGTGYMDVSPEADDDDDDGDI